MTKLIEAKIDTVEVKIDHLKENVATKEDLRRVEEKVDQVLKAMGL